ncbi:hypothetical protein [Sphingosinithalassobacter portus]|uniref:hypothetical protein n=1 Tax=Stakelama portus TaxID=2676234 RepID=UPI000D6E711B|nr:hypothetical protein [Sphingosinithalassobacter portus]
MTPATPYIGDWPTLRATAERLRDDRARTDPEFVKSGKLAPAAADARAQVAATLATIWAAVDEHRDIPEVHACDAEIRADLAWAVKAAERLVATRPDDLALARYAARLATLAHYHQPYRPGAHTALIRFLHCCNQQARADRAARNAAA